MSERKLEFADFVRLVIEALEAADIPYMIGGAVAAWAWGEPRSTIDLDLVVDIPIDHIHKLSKELEKRDMLVPAEVILDILMEERTDMPINAIHTHSGYKADLYVMRPDDEFRQTAFKRRKRVDLGPLLGEVYLHSPEDLILYKLWFYGLSRQTKHLQDIAAIVLTLREELDYTYIEDWANKKGLNTLWNEILTRIVKNPE